MARRHFDEKGVPKLDLVVREIRAFCEGGYNELRKSLDGVAWSRDVVVPVNGIYIVGSQVRVLPNDYLRGDHDLDVKVDLDHGTSTDLAREALMDTLKYWLNDEDFWKRWSEEGPAKVSREHFIDVCSTEGIDRLTKPYLQIYPMINRGE